MPQVKGIMRGEGEETFASLAQLYEETKMAPSDLQLSAIDGISFRGEDGEIIETPDREPLALDRIPFYYKDIPPEQMEHRIVYYESSRGCPFSCAYCLSSVEKGAAVPLPLKGPGRTGLFSGAEGPSGKIH